MVNAASVRKNTWHRFWVNLRSWWFSLNDREGRNIIGATSCPSCGDWVFTRDSYLPGEVENQAYFCQHEVGFQRGICAMSNKPLAPTQ